MPGKAAKVTITETQQEFLRTLRDARTSPKHLAQRAEIVLLGFEKRTNEEIAERVGLERHQVGEWRRRWRDGWQRLTLIECSETRAASERAIRETLSDLPRPGAPGIFTPEQITRIIALACEAPQKSGRPITHWTHKELADEAAKRGIVESISASRVGCFLREAELQPHKSRYWLNAKDKEKDPQAFAEQVRIVCDCYHEAKARHEQQGRHTVCVDEMTGIQALERIAPTKPMQPERPERIEFEYARHGTQTLIGNFEVASGELISPTVGPTRTEDDFVAHIETTIRGDPQAEWVFVMDQLNTHKSEGLVRFVAGAIGCDEPLGKKREAGNPEIDGQSPGISVSPGTPHPICVRPQTHVMVEPD